jgi:pSer/pThr/pTyr-binding forkhead associated (FHA) protein
MLDDPEMSRRHAVIIKAEREYFIGDLGSMNGIYLNRSRIAKRSKMPLKDGDIITMGKTSLIFKEG